MKVLKLTTLLAAGIISATSISANTLNSNEVMPRTATRPVMTANVESFLTYQNEKPIKILKYVFNNDSNKFVLSERHEYKLDEQGRYVYKYNTGEPYWYQTFEEIVYNENGRIHTSTDGLIRTDSSVNYANKHEYLYDEFYKDFITDDLYYHNYLDGEYIEWTLRNHTRLLLTCDDKNRVSKVEKTNALTDFRHEKIESAFGESSSPEKIVITKYDESSGDMFVKTTYTDIEWYSFEEQVLDEYQISRSVMGENTTNKLNKINCILTDRWGTTGEAKYYEYDDKGRIISLKNHGLLNDGSLSVPYDLEQYLYTDDFGSYVKTYYSGDDWNGDGVINDNEIVKTYKDVYVYDEHKNLVLSEKYYYGNENPLIESLKNDIEYDDEGRIAQVIETYIVHDNPEVISKTVYEYNVPTGIKNVEHKTAEMRVYDSMIALGTNAECAYSICNAEGNMVMSGSTTEGMISTVSLPSGFYIVSVNNGNGTSSVKFVK